MEMDDSGVVGLKERVGLVFRWTRGEFRKRKVGQVGRVPSRKEGRKEGNKSRAERGSRIRVPRGSRFPLAKDSAKTMKEKAKKERRKRPGKGRGWTKGAGSHSEAISDHVTRINLTTRIFFRLDVRIRLPIKRQTTARIRT